MPLLAGLAALLIISIVLWDAFETIILPRRVSRRIRVTRLVYDATWFPWRIVSRRIHNENRRESFLGFYGPLTLIFLLGVWVIALVAGFALLLWALGSPLHTPTGRTSFGVDLYFSGTTFFTLGLGDIAPLTPSARIATVAEAGTGFAVLALVIGYLPVLYQAFSRREASISLLDARAGSPPSAVELLRRHANEKSIEQLSTFLYDWEHWCAELLESHLSYPQVGFFRSQHDNQSWLSAITTVLDVCALLLVGVDDIPRQQAFRTFAMARHAVVDLSQVYGSHPRDETCYRLSADDLTRLREQLAEAGVPLRRGDDADQKLTEIRKKYEPYVGALSERLLMSLPPWIPEDHALDDWQTSSEEHVVRQSFVAIGPLDDDEYGR